MEVRCWQGLLWYKRVYLFLHRQEQTGHWSVEGTAESIPIQLKTISVKARRSWNIKQTREKEVWYHQNPHKQLTMLNWHRKAVPIKENTKKRTLKHQNLFLVWFNSVSTERIFVKLVKRGICERTISFWNSWRRQLSAPTIIVKWARN